VLGLLLFIVHTADLAAIAEKHAVSLHAFADDTQLYLHCRRVDTASAAAQLEWCIIHIGHWMSANRLKLNTEKAEHRQDRVAVGSIEIQPSKQGCCLPTFTVRLRSICTVLLSTFCLSVRLSVCLSNACIVTKRNNSLSIFQVQHRTTEQCF